MAFTVRAAVHSQDCATCLRSLLLASYRKSPAHWLFPSYITSRLSGLIALHSTVSVEPGDESPEPKSPLSLSGPPRTGNLHLKPDNGTVSRKQLCETPRDEQHQHQETRTKDLRSTTHVTSSQKSPPPMLGLADDEESGVDWTLAIPALNLLSNAQLLASRPTNQRQVKHIRRLFIDGIAYLLNSLPKDLTLVEKARLAECMPEGLEAHLSGGKQNLNDSAKQHGYAQSPRNADTKLTSGRIFHFDNEQSLFRKTVAKCFIVISFVIAFLLPYLLRTIHWIYQQEKNYKLTNRALSMLLSGIYTCSEKCLNAKDVISTLCGGRIGSTFHSAILYAIDGVFGGFGDGISRGSCVLSNTLMSG